MYKTLHHLPALALLAQLHLPIPSRHRGKRRPSVRAASCWRAARRSMPGNAKLQPHIQSSVAFRGNHKLSFRYFGPFKILAKVGSVAYKLDLPPAATIHPVVHVSQLKKHVPPNTEVLDSLHSVATDPSVKIQPAQVLSSRAIWRGGALAKQVLVQWAGQPPSMASWEDVHDMRRRHRTACGQAVAKGGGRVMNQPATQAASEGG